MVINIMPVSVFAGMDHPACLPILVVDAPAALAVNPAVGGSALVVTAISNPFLGMLAGIAARILGM